jgi:hypothetical protein
MYQDLKKMINRQKEETKVQGNMEYSTEPPEFVVKTLYQILKDRAAYNKNELGHVQKLLSQCSDFFKMVKRDLLN